MLCRICCITDWLLYGRAFCHTVFVNGAQARELRLAEMLRPRKSCLISIGARAERGVKVGVSTMNVLIAFMVTMAVAPIAT